jgi:hypothetical protein
MEECQGWRLFGSGSASDMYVYHALSVFALPRPDYKQSVYMPITVGSSVTVPFGSMVTRTPIRAESAPQPRGEHPEVYNVPVTSERATVEGMPCSVKKRDTASLLVPILSCSSASCLMDSTRRSKAAPRSLQESLWCFRAKQLAPPRTPSAAAVAMTFRPNGFTGPVSWRFAIRASNLYRACA